MLKFINMLIIVFLRRRRHILEHVSCILYGVRTLSPGKRHRQAANTELEIWKMPKEYYKRLIYMRQARKLTFCTHIVCERTKDEGSKLNNVRKCENMKIIWLPVCVGHNFNKISFGGRQNWGNKIYIVKGSKCKYFFKYFTAKLARQQAIKIRIQISTSMRLILNSF